MNFIFWFYLFILLSENAFPLPLRLCESETLTISTKVLLIRPISCPRVYTSLLGAIRVDHSSLVVQRRCPASN